MHRSSLKYLIILFVLLSLLFSANIALASEPTPTLQPTTTDEPTSFVSIAPTETMGGPTATQEPPISTAMPFKASSSAALATSTPVTNRGIAPATFQASFYNRPHLISLFLTKSYTSPIDFSLACWGETFPYTGCKLISELVDGYDYSVRWMGRLFVPTTGAYTFWLDYHDDGAQLYIDDALIADLGWNYPRPDTRQAPQTINLTTGWHTFALNYEQRMAYVAALRLLWAGPNFAQEIVPLYIEEPFTLTSVNAVNDVGGILAWDALVTDTLTVRAIGVGANAPDVLAARVQTEKSDQTTLFYLEKYIVIDDATIYQGSISTSELVSHPNELTLAAIVNEASDSDYTFVENFATNLGVPAERLMGIALGVGDEAQGRPPANLDYLKAGGYESAQVDVPGWSDVPPDDFFIKNQADVLLYLGHGYHQANVIDLLNYKITVGPQDVKDAWSNHVKTVIFLACSVFDINNYDGCADDPSSPGKAWIALPGPQTWLGFKWIAPNTSQAEAQFKILEAEYVATGDWVGAWHKATGKDLDAFRNAVAIDSAAYHYWHCWPTYNLPGTGCVCPYPKQLPPTWETVLRSKLDASSRGFEGYMASPAVMHIYDQDGRHVGPNDQGGVDTEISGAKYWAPIVAGGGHPDARRLSIPVADLSRAYQLRLVGTGNGNFSFSLEIPDRLAGTLYKVSYLEVPVIPGAIFALPLVRGTTFTLAADMNGDGVTDQDIVPSSVVIDTLDLAVNLNVSGALGQNGWYTSEVTVALNASSRPDAPTVAGFEYDLGQNWQSYQAPLSFAQEGTHALSYRANFVVGEADVTQQVNIGIDKTPPQISVNQPSAVTYPRASIFTVVYSASDDVSGLEKVTATLDGQAIVSGQVFDTSFMEPGSHVIVITARDRAGLETVATSTVTVRAINTVEELISAKHHFYDIGWIYGPGAQGIVKSLDAKLENAQKALARGQTGVAVNNLNAFINEVQAQTGKHITPQAAAILTQGARNIIDKLGLAQPK